MMQPFIDETKNIISLLKIEGLNNETKEVEDALFGSCTSSELLMLVVLALSKIDLTKVSPSLCEKIKEHIQVAKQKFAS